MHFFKRKKVPRGVTLINQVMHALWRQITIPNTYKQCLEKSILIFNRLPQHIAKQGIENLFNTQEVNLQTPAHLSTDAPSEGVFFEKNFQTSGKKSYIKGLGEKLKFLSQN